MKRRINTGIDVLCDVPNGEAFKYNDQLFMATDCVLPGEGRECANLETGEMRIFSQGLVVERCMVELIILNDVNQ